MRSRTIVIGLVALLLAGAAHAGDLSLRLVEASNSGDSSSGSLSDVIDVLQKTLRFKTYRLKASGTSPLPASNKSVSLDGYSVICNGSQGNLSIKVKRGSKTVLETSAALRKGKPFVIGGLPGSGDVKLILILVAH